MQIKSNQANKQGFLHALWLWEWYWFFSCTSRTTNRRLNHHQGFYALFSLPIWRETRHHAFPEAKLFAWNIRTIFLDVLVLLNPSLKNEKEFRVVGITSWVHQRRNLWSFFSGSENEKVVLLCVVLLFRELSTKDISSDVEFWFQSKASKAEKECYFWYFFFTEAVIQKSIHVMWKWIVMTSFRHVNKFQVICLILFHKNLLFNDDTMYFKISSNVASNSFWLSIMKYYQILFVLL